LSRVVEWVSKTMLTVSGHSPNDRRPVSSCGDDTGHDGCVPVARLPFMTEMYCFRCLTTDNKRVPAVTAFVGTYLCDSCAHGEERLRRQMIQEAASSMRL
jgi:hypothetical protein